jgi:hypothetical protein
MQGGACGFKLPVETGGGVMSTSIRITAGKITVAAELADTDLAKTIAGKIRIEKA